LQGPFNRPDEYGAGCPKDCGCPHTKKDCPRHYDISLVEQSANVVLDKDAIQHYEIELESRHIVAAGECANQQGLETGGWCLGGFGGDSGTLVVPDGRQIRIPKHHVAASRNIVNTLLGMKQFCDPFIYPTLTNTDFTLGVFRSLQERKCY
jgi:hypothetical protein